MNTSKPIDERVAHSNAVFRLYLLDLIQSKGITKYKLAKDCKIQPAFIYNKINGYSRHYVSILTIQLIANTHNFNFDLFKYENMLKEQEKDKK